MQYCRGGACPSRRRTNSSYRPLLKWKKPPNCHCEEAKGRRGALSAQREEVPLGCNLAVPARITEKLRRIWQCYAAGRRGRRPLQWRVRSAIMPPNPRPARRSGSAATDAIGLYVLSALCTNWKCLPEIATAPLGPRNDKSGAFTIVTATGTSRSCGAGRGQPGPYKARAFARRSVQIGSAFPRLPRAQSALAMTNLEALCIPRSMIHSTLAHPA